MYQQLLENKMAAEITTSRHLYMFDLSLPLSRIETTRNCVTKLILTQGQIYS
jgi:hypothetical protein